MNLNYSKQREDIKNFLKSRKNHPTADVIYKNLRILYPNISLGTIYRNLSLLLKTNDIQKISYGDNSEHFDGNPNEHYHFVCKECGAVIDLEMPKIDIIDFVAKSIFDGEIYNHNLVFSGICVKCLKKY